MRPGRRFAAVAVAVCLLVPAGLASGEEDPCAGRVCAGAGKADMTPPVGVPMGGFFARSVASSPQPWVEQLADRGPDPNLYAKTFRQSEGIHTPLHTRALVVQAPDGRRFAFASVENRGAPYELHQAVAARLEAAGAGIPPGHLLFSSTHSHAAPSPMSPYAAYGAISTDLFDPRVFEVVADALTTAVLDGVARLEPARLGVGRTELLGASRNRRMDQFALNPEASPDDTADAPPAMDPTVTVLRAEAADGRPIGAFFVFALHGTTLGDSNPLLSGDNMGPAMRFCEAALGQRSDDGPVPVCAQANGAEGDISPVADDADVWLPGAYARAEQTGRQVAGAVLEAWDAAETAADLTLDVRFHVLYFRGQDGDPGEPTSPVPMVGVGGNFGDGVGLPVDLPGQGNKLPIGSGAGGYPQWAPLQVVRVGDAGFLSVPGEMTTTMGTRVREAVLAAVPGLLSDAVVVGLANTYVSYMTTPQEYAANRYEGAWSLYGPQQGNLIRNELVRLAVDMADGVHGDYEQAPPLGELLGAPPTPPRPDDPGSVGSALVQPGSVVRGEVVSFTWVGGNPAVERPRGTDLLRLERETTDGWSVVATEDDTFTAVRVDRDGSTHLWTAIADLPLDLEPGRYRFSVDGRYASASGPVVYDAVSDPFEVDVSRALVPEVTVAGEEVTVRGLWPQPDGERFATRPRQATGTAVVEVLRNGEAVESHTVPLGVPTAIDLVSGDVLRVAAGALVDGWGNTNATPALLSVG